MSFFLDTDGDNVELRSPDSDEGHRLHFNDVRGLTQTGALRYVADNDHWASLKVRSYKFSAITDVEVESEESLTNLLTKVKDCIKKNAGLAIKIKDADGTSLSGVILSPSIEIITVKEPCTFNFSFEFQITP
jgi:hypothetical protein